MEVGTFDLGYDLDIGIDEFDDEMDMIMAEIEIPEVSEEMEVPEMPQPDPEPVPSTSTQAEEPSNSRFAKCSSEDINNLLSHKESKSTKANTKWAIKTTGPFIGGKQSFHPSMKANIVTFIS